LSQDCFYRSELIIIDDCSSDETHEIALEYLNKGRVKVLRNEINMGLSSSSNRAINLARGEYIMRVDADDMLLGSRIASDLMYSSIYHGNDVVYPMHYDQRTKEITQGDLNHHVGGALFSSKALRAVQFTEGLRTYEGLDLFERAKNSLKIGYFDAYPAFFYRDKPGSLSSPNPFREGIKKKIDQGLTGEKLLA
jgi:glycosyltransferase involved in cell wall biosynthesis